MTNRYKNRSTYINTKKIYDTHFKSRGIKNGISHYGTPTMRKLTIEEIGNLEISTTTWKTGDKLYKLAHEYYNNSEMWWVIAWFNRKPTDAHFKAGDIVYIPGPLEIVLSYYGY